MTRFFSKLFQSYSMKLWARLSLLLSVSPLIYGWPAMAGEAHDLASSVRSGEPSAQSPAYKAEQTIYDLVPSQFAADVEAKFDPLTGRTEYIAQDFDPFESHNNIAGSARLRSASTGISRDGVNVEGGAYLDVSILYSAQSRDPYDAKGFEYGVYMNGHPVDIMTYDVETLDCNRDVTRVTYDQSYYRGAYHGLLAGIYRPFPRYRGHRHYSRRCDTIRFGPWRAWQNRYVDYRGYDRRRLAWSRGSRGHGSRHHTRHDHRDHHYDHGRHDYRSDSRGYNGDGYRRHNGEHGNRQHVDRNNDRSNQRDLSHTRHNGGRNMGQVDPRVVSTQTVIRPDRMGDRRLTNSTSANSRPDRAIASSVGQPRRSPARARTRANVGHHMRNNNTGNMRSHGAQSRSAEPSRSRSNSSMTPAERRHISIERRVRERGDYGRSTHKRSAREGSIRGSRRSNFTASETANGSTTRRSSKKVTGYVSSSRPSHKHKAQRRLSEMGSSKKTSSSKNTSSSKRTSTSKSDSSRSNNVRKMNNHFKRQHSKIKRLRQYFSDSYTTTTHVDTNCLKEERLSLHIPVERLRAARFDGLSIALLGRNDQDIPLYIPPNYIEGFLMANPYIAQGAIYSSPTRSGDSVSGYP